MGDYDKYYNQGSRNNNLSSTEEGFSVHNENEEKLPWLDGIEGAEYAQQLYPNEEIQFRENNLSSYPSGNLALTEIIRLLNAARNNCMGGWKELPSNANGQEVKEALIVFQNAANAKFKDGRYDNDTREKLEGWAYGMYASCSANISYEKERKLPKIDEKSRVIALLNRIHENCFGIDWPYLYGEVDDEKLLEAIVLFQNWANTEVKDGTYDIETAQRLNDLANWSFNLCQETPNLDVIMGVKGKNVSRYTAHSKWTMSEKDFIETVSTLLQPLVDFIIDSDLAIVLDSVIAYATIAEADLQKLMTFFESLPIEWGKIKTDTHRWSTIKTQVLNSAKAAKTAEMSVSDMLSRVALAVQIATVLYRLCMLLLAYADGDENKIDESWNRFAASVLSATATFVTLKTGAGGAIIGLFIAIMDIIFLLASDGEVDFWYCLVLGIRSIIDAIAENVKTPTPAPITYSPPNGGSVIQPGWNVQTHVHGDYYDGPKIGPDPGGRRF